MADHSNLMARDDMVNLGLGDVGTDNPQRVAPAGTTPAAAATATAKGAGQTSKPVGGGAERI